MKNNLETVSNMLRLFRRTGQTTALINAARCVKGWVIVGNEDEAIRLRKLHNYESVFGMQELEIKSTKSGAELTYGTGKMPIMFWDIHGVKELVRESRPEPIIHVECEMLYVNVYVKENGKSFYINRTHSYHINEKDLYMSSYTFKQNIGRAGWECIKGRDLFKEGASYSYEAIYQLCMGDGGKWE